MQPTYFPPPQLSEEHLNQLASARLKLRPIKRAVSVAQLEGWSIAVFAVLNLAIGYNDPTNIILGLCFGTISYFELRGADNLRKLQPGATRMLSWVQLAIAAVLMVYGGWRLLDELKGKGAVSDIDPEVAQILGDYGSLISHVMVIFYAALIALAIFYCGGMCLYYISRRKQVETYVRETPPWIIAMQKAGMSI